MLVRVLFVSLFVCLRVCLRLLHNVEIYKMYFLRICETNFMRCYTETEVANATFYLRRATVVPMCGAQTLCPV